MKSKIKILIAITVSIFIFSASFAHADAISDFYDWARRVIAVLVAAIVLGSVLTLIIAAYRYMAAAGNPEELQKSKQMIIIAVTSVILVFLAWGILAYLAPQLVPLFPQFWKSYTSPIPR
jgi:uncharacterized membrane protein YidH (DUF202 family)